MLKGDRVGIKRVFGCIKFKRNEEIFVNNPVVTDIITTITNSCLASMMQILDGERELLRELLFAKRLRCAIASWSNVIHVIAEIKSCDGGV